MLKQAKDDTNPKRQRSKMIAAKNLLNYPIKTLRKMKIKDMQRSFLQTVPQKCKSFVKDAFGQTLDAHNLKKVSLDSINAKTVSLAAVDSQEGYKLIHEDHLNSMLAQRFSSWMKNKMLAQENTPHTIKDEKAPTNLNQVQMTKIKSINPKAQHTLKATGSSVKGSGKHKLSKMQVNQMKSLEKDMAKKRTSAAVKRSK